ncbi:hypothetical protein BDD12DRAFT_842742 [Trichophaea hybrida]|nr:hypothetical protein BDD12DRAFT_842742 [Trichophaea hybrida]
MTGYVFDENLIHFYLLKHNMSLGIPCFGFFEDSGVWLAAGKLIEVKLLGLPRAYGFEIRTICGDTGDITDHDEDIVMECHYR